MNMGNAPILALAAAAAFSTAARAADPADALTIIEDWPEVARSAAESMLEKYGDPDEATEEMLIWNENGPWLQTIVYSEEIDHDFPLPHKDVLEQFIAYDVPPDMFDELATYDGSVIVERTKGVMSARCDKEGANFLALNLAHRIVEGEIDVEQARQSYADAIRAFMDGEQVAMMQELQFEPPTRMAAADPGEALIQVATRE